LGDEPHFVSTEKEDPRMHDEPTRINPPLFLASTVIGCWHCGADMPAVALVAPNVPETEGTVCILSDIRQLPQSVLTFIHNRFPTFKLKYSKMARSEYYANTCPKCGVLSGDFYLHAEPGAPFFPTDAEEAAELTIEQIPISQSIEVQAGHGMGVGKLILECAKRIEAE